MSPAGSLGSIEFLGSFPDPLHPLDPPLLLTKTEIEKGVDETNYATLIAERGESA